MYNWSYTDSSGDWISDSTSDSLITINPNSLDIGIRHIKLEVCDSFGLCRSETLKIRIKSADPSDYPPRADIVNVSTEPFNNDFFETTAGDSMLLFVTGCHDVIMEGYGCDDHEICPELYNGGLSDSGYRSGSIWESGDFSGNHGGFSAKYYLDELVYSSFTEYPISFKIKDDDDIWSDTVSDWASGTYTLEGLAMYDADSLVVNVQFPDVCELSCCPENGSCKDYNLFSGDNTANSGPCCGDDRGEYFLELNGYSKCCDNFYDTINDGGCYDLSGDFDMSGCVDLSDTIEFVSCYQGDQYYSLCDLSPRYNPDGIVDLSDVVSFASYFGNGCDTTRGEICDNICRSGEREVINLFREYCGCEKVIISDVKVQDVPIPE